MTQEEKQLLLKDLCGRLPYRVKINCFDIPRTLESISIDCDEFITIDCGGEHFYHPLSNILHKDCLPCLRPMSSMTEDEFGFLQERLPYDFTRIYSGKFDLINDIRLGNSVSIDDMSFLLDCLNKWYLDYRGLIPMGLAIEAPEDMYNTKTE